jgi:adenosylcobinamide kinase/adenosylcobinamide-phosphate guanylyltransferase
MGKKCFLVLGGARSGKSRFAEEVASQLGDRVLFVATGEALDEEMRLRIEDHRQSRHPGWRTIEAPIGVGRRIQEEFGDAQVVIVDCLTLLVSNVIGYCGDDAEQVDPKLVEDRLALEIKELVECIDGMDASLIIVSNEVGMGLVPENRLGRLYRDLLGRANQELARHADDIRLMVAGIALDVKGPARL